jgi:hypothetical protein
MFQHSDRPARSRRVYRNQCVTTLQRLPALSLATGLTLATAVPAAQGAPAAAEPFKVANIHFETNASACDMGIQIKFDTEGVTRGSVRDPNGHKVYSFRSTAGMRRTGGQTEGFLEGVEPQIPELVSALGCEPSTDEGTLPLADLLDTWPAGNYTFEGQSKESKSSGQAMLTHLIPAGPEVTAPADGTELPAATPVVIDWNPVTEPILPDLGPVSVVGYHVIVEEAGGEVTPSLDVDLSSNETSLTVPSQFLRPATVYRFEVLSTEESGNQTITEGFFCTADVADCVVPD